MLTTDKNYRKKFSIIIASLNCGLKIEDTLKSIFAQNEKLFELIVVDGGSTDQTLDLISKYRGRLTLVSEKDEGIYEAFNKGIELSKGNYIYFIGAGDRLRPGILEEIKDLLPSDEPTFFYGQCFFMKQQLPNGKLFKAHTFIHNNICHQGVFHHRRIYELLGKYDLKYKVFADWFFNLRCFLDERISKVYIPRIIADYEEGGLSSEIGRDRPFQKDFPLFIGRHFGFFQYLVCKAFVTNQNLFNFFYFKGYNFIRKIVPVARPFVHRWRHLKKSLIKNQ